MAAVARDAHSGKNDQMPDTWSPGTPTGDCFYARRIITIATTYDLPITRAEARNLATLMNQCGE